MERQKGLKSVLSLGHVVCLALAAAGLIVGLSNNAFSAGRMPGAPATGPSVYNWTGFHVGMHVGVGWVKDDVAVGWSDPGNVAGVGYAVANGVIPLNFSLRPNGLIGGFQVGYDYQTHSNWVIGAEADISVPDWSGSQEIHTAAGGSFYPLVESVSKETKWFSTLRGRIGYATGNWLLYATGGAACGRNTYGFMQSNVAGGGPIYFTGSSSSTDFGWTGGVGIEFGRGKWTLRFEYLHYDLGDHSFSVPLNTVPTATFIPTFENKGGMVRFGLNYRFGLGG